MYCADCGARNEAGSTFCRECGVRLPVAETGPPAARPAERERQSPLERAAALRDAGDTDGAIEVCRSVIIREPRSRAAHALLGTLYERKGQAEAAVREYRVVLEIDPRSAAERQRLARLLEQPEEPPLEPIDEPPRRPARRPSLLIVGGAAAALALIAIIAAAIHSRSGRSGKAGPVSLSIASPEAAGYAASPGARMPGAWGGPPYPVRPTGIDPFGAVLRTTPSPREPRPAVQPAAPPSSTGSHRIDLDEDIPSVAHRPPAIPVSPPKPAPVAPTPPAGDERTENMVVPVGEGGGEGPGTEATSEGPGMTPAGEGPGSKLEIWVSPKTAHPEVAPPPPRSAAKQPSETKATPDVEEQARRRLETAGNLRRKGDARAALDEYRVAADLYGKLLSGGRDSSRIKLGKDACEKGIRACQASLGE